MRLHLWHDAWERGNDIREGVTWMSRLYKWGLRFVSPEPFLLNLITDNYKRKRPRHHDLLKVEVIGVICSQDMKRRSILGRRNRNPQDSKSPALGTATVEATPKRYNDYGPSVDPELEFRVWWVHGWSITTIWGDLLQDVESCTITININWSPAGWWWQ